MGEVEAAMDVPARKKPISMHEGIAAWCDCCSCEAEPRWLEVGEEMGIRFSDYEDDKTEAGDADAATRRRPHHEGS